jgi:hypothetical protein
MDNDTNYERQIDENWPIEARFMMRNLIRQYEADILNERYKRQRIEERYISLSNVLERLLKLLRISRSIWKWKKNRKFIFEQINYAESEISKLRSYCEENDEIDYG